MEQVVFDRQLGLVDSSIFDTPITVVGAGGIGSFTTLALAKIGFKNIAVWDFDIIEPHNLPNQFYRLDDVGKYKVEALEEIVLAFTGTKILGFKEIWHKDIDMQGLVISAVDSMKVRAEIYDSIKRNIRVRAFIDGRMGSNQLEIYTTRIDSSLDKKAYTKTLWKDSETANIPCTERAVMYNVLTIASWIVNQARLVLSGKAYHREMILDLENMILILPVEKK